MESKGVAARTRSALLMALAMMAGTAGTALAADITTEDVDPFRAALFDDATVTLHLRNYLFDMSHNGDNNPAAWALGGWAGYQTGWIGDFLQFGAAGYTSQPLWAPSDRAGTLMLLPDGGGITVLGQAYAALRYDGQLLTLYRQLVNQPEVNAYDNRMVPSTFEGISLTGTIGSMSYYASYLTRIKPRDADHFVNIARAAGVDRDEPMYLGGLSFSAHQGIQAQTSLYVVPNLLASSYSDAQWNVGLAGADRLTLSGQFMVQSGIGDELLTGPDFHSLMAGLLGEFTHDNVTLTAGYTANASNQEWQYPYGNWPGYTNMVIGSFSRAGEQAVLLGASYDMSAFGLKGLTLGAQAAVDTHVAQDLAMWKEYDFSANYSLSAISNAPHWMEPFSLEADYAILQSNNVGPQSDVTNDIPVRLNSDELRIILNYELQLNGRNL